MEAKETTVADSVIATLHELGCKTFFGVSGGSALHLLHSAEEADDVVLQPLNHEQSVAMAAESFSRVSREGGIGVGIATSGPGATNLLTGIAGAFLDSVPVFMITGQVASFRSSEGWGVRNYGFQETDVVRMATPVTKLSIQLRKGVDPVTLVRELFFEAKQERQGPVLLDIPDDFQRMPYERFLSL